ncbi:MAG: 5-oxoprolinase/urea amidolyase family protein [Micromonosporaceae bacterium]|nr:5-oxoprolinase/urea amidolyase family protein [Micromonosporaceae bacterium]
MEVRRAGALTTVQDHGRRGYAHLGVPRSGALDRPALSWANRLVGNPPSAAGLELTVTGATLRLWVATTVALTGAPARLRVAGAEAPFGVPVPVPAGAEVRIGAAMVGVRSYLAVAGGITLPPVLGSRSTDTLSGLGPPPLADGVVLPVGAAARVPRPDPAPDRRAGPGQLAAPGSGTTLRLHPGPRRDWLTDASLAGLLAGSYQVSPLSNRIGARLTGGPPLHRARAGELASEGMTLGAVQVPSDRQPLILLADHPTTGGYPVVAIVEPADLPLLAQLRPGAPVRFRPHETSQWT